MNAEIKTGDTVEVGDIAYEKNMTGVTEQEVVVVKKTYNRDGVVARITALETELTKFQAILVEIDRVD